jgi:hypothetical protein
MGNEFSASAFACEDAVAGVGKWLRARANTGMKMQAEKF